MSVITRLRRAALHYARCSGRDPHYTVIPEDDKISGGLLRVSIVSTEPAFLQKDYWSQHLMMMIYIDAAECVNAMQYIKPK